MGWWSFVSYLPQDCGGQASGYTVPTVSLGARSLTQCTAGVLQLFDE